jgi:hypothetical protein
MAKEDTLLPLLDPEKEGNTIIRNVDKSLPVYAVKHTIGLES